MKKEKLFFCESENNFVSNSIVSLQKIINKVAITEHYYTQFEEGRNYHIYNRSVDRKPLYCNEGNYDFFLKQYEKYLDPVLETYSYCLLGNHFHLLIGIKNLANFRDTEQIDITKTTHDIVSHQFRKFFQSYSMAFNKQQNRTGTLFQTPFKRSFVDNDYYFKKLVHYIHGNPQMHGLTNDFREWHFSSYNKMAKGGKSILSKNIVLDFFGGKDNFHKTHQDVFQEIRQYRFSLEINQGD